MLLHFQQSKIMFSSLLLADDIYSQERYSDTFSLWRPVCEPIAHKTNKKQPIENKITNQSAARFWKGFVIKFL